MKYSVQMFMNMRNITVFLLVVAVVIPVVYIAYSTHVPPSTGEVQPASYIVFIEGINYYAKDDKTGLTQFDGRDADVVIQSALNALDGTNGGIIHLKAGTYPIDATLTLDTGQTLEGDPNSATRIQGLAGMASTTDYVALQDVNSSFVTIRDLYIDGVADRGNDAIHLDNTGGTPEVPAGGTTDFGHLVQNIVVESVGGDGFFVKGGGEIMVSNYFVHSADKIGMYVLDDDGKYSNLFVCNTGEQAIKIGEDDSGVSVSNNRLDNVKACLAGRNTAANGHGLHLNKAHHTLITNYHGEDNFAHALLIDGTSAHNTIVGGSFKDSDCNEDDVGDGIRFASTANGSPKNNRIVGGISGDFKGVISGVCTDASRQDRGFNIEAGSNNYISDLTLSGNEFDPSISPVTLTNNNRMDNILDIDNSKFSENKVISTGSINLQTRGVQSINVAHNLIGTPNTHDCQVSIIRNTNVSAHRFSIIRIASADATNVTVEVKLDVQEPAAAKASIALYCDI